MSFFKKFILCLIVLSLSALFLKYMVDACLYDPSSRIFTRAPASQNLCRAVNRADLNARREIIVPDSARRPFFSTRVSTTERIRTSIRLLVQRPTIFFARIPRDGFFTTLFFLSLISFSVVLAGLWHSFESFLGLRETSTKDTGRKRGRRITATYRLLPDDELYSAVRRRTRLRDRDDGSAGRKGTGSTDTEGTTTTRRPGGSGTHPRGTSQTGSFSDERQSGSGGGLDSSGSYRASNRTGTNLPVVDDDDEARDSSGGYPGPRRSSSQSGSYPQAPAPLPETAKKNGEEDT